MPFIVGIDIGGTFTDALAAEVGSGAVYSAKVRSTPNDLTEGVLEALDMLAEQAGLSAEALLGDTLKLAHGTTQTSNVMYTWSGARTALLATRGFGEELLIMRARGRVAGLGLSERRHFRTTDKPPQIVPRAMIEEVVERVDHHGVALVPLSDEECRRAVEAVLARGPEAVAVALLWSPTNPEHELMLERALKQRAPGLYVSLSHRLAPVIGEYERTATTAVNAYVGPTVSRYLERLDGLLRGRGLTRPLLIQQASGGAAQVEETEPVNTIESGPAAGMVAVKRFADAAGFPNVLATDVGGTTFKVGLLVDGEWSLAQETIINQYGLLVPMIDLVSIGAGGGSIAWVDDTRLRIGPQSAGADPGPACYGWGGTEPTVTDADAVLGFLNPQRFLGGRLRLDVDLARQAIKQRLADRLFGGDVVRAAAGIRQVVDHQMADLVRKMSIERGHDPREFIMMAYGGAGPVHGAAYAREVGVRQVVVPPAATVYSAFGAAASDVHHSLPRSLWGRFPDNLDAVRAGFAQLEAHARELLARQGISAERMRLSRWLDLKYERQLHDVRVPAPDRKIDAAFGEAVANGFEARYIALYGEDALIRARLRLLRIGIEAEGLIDKPALARLPLEGPGPSKAEQPGRQVFWPEAGAWLETRVFDGERLRPGNRLAGPAIVELAGTSIAIPPGDTAEIDAYGNTIITLNTGATA